MNALRIVAAVVATLCVLTLAIAGIARSTVLSRHYYQLVLDDEHTYDRIYDQVLVDPASAGLLATCSPGCPFRTPRCSPI